MKRRFVRLMVGCAVGLCSAVSMSSPALAIDEFPVPTPDSRPAGITAGPGGIWFTEEHTNANRIGLFTGSGFAEFGGLSPAPPPSSGQPPETGPAEIVLGPDGNLWFTELGAARIGRISPGGALLNECSLSSGSQPDGITVGPDNQIWFTLSSANRIGRINPLAANPCSTYADFSGGLSQPSDITAGPDGKLWFTESSGSRVSSITLSGGISRPSSLSFASGSEPSGITASSAAIWATLSASNQIVRIDPTTATVTHVVATGAGPSAIATGPDGALWFTETLANKIGRLTAGASPSLTNEFVVPTPNSQPGGITLGADGALWFTEFAANKIGRIAPAPPFVPPPPPPPAAPAAKKKKCKVPKLRRLTVKKARKKLKRAGCKYRIRGKGRFVSSKPKAGRTTTATVIVKFKKAKKKRR